MKRLIALNSAIQRKKTRFLAYGLAELISKTMPRLYLREFMRFNNFGSAETKPCLTLSFDCDLREDIEAFPVLLSALDKHGIKASFAVIGKWLEQYPEEHKLLLREGHEIMNHTYTHPHNRIFNPDVKFNQLSYAGQKEEIQRFDEVCKHILNYEPAGFRTPHFGGLHTQSVYSILSELNYKYSSSTIATRTNNFGMPYREGDIFEIPLSPCPGYPFFCLETWALRRAPRRRYKSEQEFLGLFREIIELGQSSGAYLNFYFDPMDVAKMECFDEMLSLVKDFTVLPYRELISGLRNQDG